jgi:polyhydroxybutyrate depolymerase
MTRLAFFTLLSIAACGGDDGNPPDAPPTTFGGDRPVNLQVPLLTEGEQYPLVLILHGFGANGFVQQAYFGMNKLAEERGMFVLAPDGLADSTGKQFWNADDTCCDFENKNPDDVAYLGGLIDDVMAAWPVDPQRVRVIGHSNGGFMSYRLACDRADVVTSIVSLAGNAVNVPCTPSEAVHVLHVHGTADDTVPFAGGPASVDAWAGLDGCTGERSDGGTLDLDQGITGDETQTATTAGCPSGGAVELWTMNGSGHVPSLFASFEANVSLWWDDHPRP